MSRSRVSTGGQRSVARLRCGLDELPGRAPEAARPLVEGWVRWIEQQFGSSVLAGAVDEARQGRLTSLQISPSRSTAALRGGTRLSSITVRFPELDSGQWRRLLESLAQEAMSEASLLAGELPPGLNDLASAAAAPLCPTADERVQFVSEPTRGDVEDERGAAIVCLCVLEELVQAPELVFLLRGLPIDEVLQQLRDMRVMQVQGAAAAHADPFISATAQRHEPLRECLDEFWGSGSALSELERMPPAEHAPQALLRRLGPSPLGGKFPLVGLLASVYDVVSVSARRLRDHAERIDEDNTGGHANDTSDVSPDAQQHA